MGTSNKALMKISKLIFLGFSINEKVTKKMMLVGNPINKLNKNFNNSYSPFIKGGTTVTSKKTEGKKTSSPIDSVTSSVSVKTPTDMSTSVATQKEKTTQTG